MRSLVVTTPAPDTTLLTIAELRDAAGLAVGDSSRDTELRALETRVSASINSECNIAIGQGAEPTLRQETLTETFYSPLGYGLMLSRRHNVSITSMTLDGVTVDAGDRFVDYENGIIHRLQTDYPLVWGGRIAVVVYQAGFATVPGDLKQAALDFFRSLLNESGRDPFVKSITEDVPGIMSRSTDYWVGSVPGMSGEGAVPSIVAGQLKRFRIPAIA